MRTRLAPYGRVMILVGVVAVAVCSAAVWFADQPEPSIFAALRARQEGATAAAELALRSEPTGTCVAPSASDLGPLVDLGPWDKVCVSSYVADPDPKPVSRVEYNRPPGSNAFGLTYATTKPDQPESCISHIAGEWWAVRQADGQHPEKPCPNGFTYLASG